MGTVVALPERRKLHGYPDWLRNTHDALACDVLRIDPPLRLPWHYTPEQESAGGAWECDAVWLHCARLPNGACACPAVAHDLGMALETLRRDVDLARYTLLVDPGGLSYDPRRLGGDHQIHVPETGRRFTLSARRGQMPGTSILLAIDWGLL